MKRRSKTWRAVLVVTGMAVFGAGALVLVALVHALTPKDISKRPPAEVFRWLVCDPIPPSVTGIRASGKLMFAGDGVVIEFFIQPGDVPTLLRTGGFGEIGDFGPPLHGLTQEPTSASDWRAYNKTNAGYGATKWVRLWIETDTSRAYVHYSRI